VAAYPDMDSTGYPGQQLPYTVEDMLYERIDDVEPDNLRVINSPLVHVHGSIVLIGKNQPIIGDVYFIRQIDGSYSQAVIVVDEVANSYYSDEIELITPELMEVHLAEIAPE